MALLLLHVISLPRDWSGVLDVDGDFQIAIIDICIGSSRGSPGGFRKLSVELPSARLTAEFGGELAGSAVMAVDTRPKLGGTSAQSALN